MSEELGSVEIPGVTVDLHLSRGKPPMVMVYPRGNDDGTATLEVFASGIEKSELVALLNVLATTIEESDDNERT